MRATLQSVATKAGVSPSTASLALNGRGAQVGLAKSTLARIEQAALDLGYEANQMATALRLKRSHAIGVLWSLVGPHNSNQMVRCFSQKAHEFGYATQVYDSLGDPKLIDNQLRELLRRRVDGAVIQLPVLEKNQRPSKELIDRISRIPKVVASGYFEIPNLPFPYIFQSRNQALHDALRHVLQSGRDKIGFLGSHRNDSKVWGLKEALIKEGRSPEDLLIIHNPFLESDNLNLVAHTPALIETSEIRKVNALFTSTDELAALAIASLRKDQIQVPQDIAVIGFNNSSIASFFQPAIASIERYDAHIANLAIQHLISSIENPDFKISPIQTVEMKFILRASAG